MSVHSVTPLRPVNCCMVVRINVDCNACSRKIRRILLSMKEIETHLIAKEQCKVQVCGTFTPSDVAIKLRRKMRRRVEILEVGELHDSNIDQKAVPTSHS